MSSEGFACDRCHRRKTKCDKEQPQCGSCVRAGAECIYSDRTREPVVRRDVVEKLERRVRQLKSANLALTERLSSTCERTVHANTVNEVNDVANEVSYLAGHAGGDRQSFLGATSGIFLANVVKTGLSGRTVNSFETRLTDVSPGDGQEGPSDSWEVDEVFTLPPRKLASSLTEAYLAHDHICYPFLLPDTIRAAVSSIYEDASFYRRSPFEAFVFNMLLAIGTSQIHKFNWQALPDAETHHLRAMAHLDSILSIGGLRALQAILLLCQYRLGSSTRDASGSLWQLVGIAARMSLELGLHRESSYRNGHSGSMDNEIELRRRCFWCAFALDRVVSLTLGRPFAIHLEDVDVQLPDANQDSLFNADVTPRSVADGVTSSPNVTTSKTAIFVHIVRYRALCGRISTSLHRDKPRTREAGNEILQSRIKLAEELRAWRAETLQLDLSEIDLSTPLAEARSSFRSLAWHEMLYHNGVLLLFRPSSIADSEDNEGSLDEVFSAARQAITLYAYLFRSRKINCSWVTLHAVFMAGLSYVYALSRHLRGHRRQMVDSGSQASTALSSMPTIPQMVSDCRACSNVLVAVSERCNAQKNCHEVFDRLSDAVLADAVDAISRPLSGTQPSGSGTSTGVDRSMLFQVPVPNQAHTFPNQNCEQIQQETAQYPENLLASNANPYSQYDTSIPVLATDDALRDCYPNLQQMYDGQWGNDSILQLSTEWLGEVYPVQQSFDWRIP